MSRWFFFIFSILVGLSAGLLYGWKISPVEYTNTVPATMRVDYRADYVLMVAEIYHSEGDLTKALGRLAMLGSPSPQDTVHQALLFAEAHGYNDADLSQMRILAAAMQSLSSPPGTSTP